ncbi:uncharacterized protein LOC108607426 isoform X2 [Drosophila busckii]|nr:uncharacterized protein LOC108607426 isoform X2 [Drosophila busckii]
MAFAKNDLTKLIKPTTQSLLELCSCGCKWSSNGQLIDSLLTIDDSFLNTRYVLTKVPFSNASCSCLNKGSERPIFSKQKQMKYAHMSCRLFLTRCAVTIIVSMLFFLASAQDVHSQSEGTKISGSIDFSNDTSGSQQTNANTTKQFKNHYKFTTTTALPLLDVEISTNQVPTSTSSIKLLNMKSRRNSMNKERNGLASGGGFSMNRNSLINSDNALQRQLREKAKQDSLESIKMHILMRLNLKKLPNITKPISVPQNILENFYKNYNATLSKTMWRPDPDAFGKIRTQYFNEDLSKIMSNTSNNPMQLNVDRNQNFGLLEEPASESSELQGDDPNAFDDSLQPHNVRVKKNDKFQHAQSNEFFMNTEDDSREYENILSHISSIYVFPEQPHVRHNRNPDVFRFKLDSSYSDISHITLHLYLRGLEWIKINQPNLIEEIADLQNRDIIVAVHLTNVTNYNPKENIFEFHHKIPTGLGKWVNVDLKPLFDHSMSALPIAEAINKTQEIFIKGVETWMKPLIVMTDNASKNPLTVHIEIGSQKKHRRKRSVFMDCTESDHDMRCCRYPLKVNFTSFGWHFVVAPTIFDAYFCSGDCRVGYLEQYPHTHLAALTTSATPCCSPTKMSSLSLLYFDDNHNLVLSVIPNMSVEGCSCS